MKKRIGYSAKLMVLFIFVLGFFKSTAQSTWTVNAAIAQKLDAAVYLPTLEYMAFFHGTQVYYHPVAEGEAMQGELSTFSSFPSNWSEITAAAKWTDSIILLFNGSKFTMMEMDAEGNVSFSAVKTFAGLPENWNGRLDGAVNSGDKKITFYAANQYVTYDMVAKTFSAVSTLADFQGWNQQLDNFDAVGTISDGQIYFFGNQSYLAFDEFTKSFSPSTVPLNDMSDVGLPPGIDNESADVGLPPAIDENNASPQVAEETVAADTGINTDGWCQVGVPQGSSASDLVADDIFMERGGEGTLFEDELPQGARIDEVRVWGSWVIMGIQVVIQNKNGELQEMPVLGTKKGKTQVFKLNEDECITGINGTNRGDAGDFIQTIRFKTNKRQSKIFGKTRGKRKYDVNIPSGTSFYGFKIKHDNYLSALGLKFVGFEGEYKTPESPSVNEEVASSTRESETTAKGSETSTQETNTDEWKDDMEDFLPIVQSEQYFSEEGSKALPASKWLGRGVDILALNPMHISNISARARKNSPITLVLSRRKGGQENKNLLHHGTDYDITGSGEGSDNQKWIESSRDWAMTFGGSIGTSMNTPVGGGGATYSFSQMNGTHLGSKEIFYSRTKKRSMFNLRLEEKWRDKKTGKKHRQLLDFDFRHLIDNLPVPSTSVSRNAKPPKKGGRLPSAIEKVKDQYLKVIEKFGTHYSKNVVYGGFYVSYTKVKKTDFVKSRETKFGFKQKVEAQIKMVELGVDVAFDIEDKKTNSKSTFNLDTRNYSQGADGALDYDTWNQNLSYKPVPIEVFLIPNYDLLTEVFFPKDKNIKKKLAILKLVTEQYMIENQILLPDSDDSFYDKTNELATAPKRLIVTVTAIKCLRVDNRELGEDNEYYGKISGSFNGKSKNNATSKVFWDVPEGYADNDQVVRGGLVPINESWTIDVAPNADPNSTITITANLLEFENWPYKHPPLGEAKYSVKLKDIPDSGLDYDLKDFPNPWEGGDLQAVQITIRKEVPMN